MKDRYVVREDGTFPRPFRVHDEKLRSIVCDSATEETAQRIADDMNKVLPLPWSQRVLGKLAEWKLSLRFAAARKGKA
jgi:hypothetical protein